MDRRLEKVDWRCEKGDSIVGLRKGTGDVRKGTGGVKKGSTFNLAGEF